MIPIRSASQIEKLRKAGHINAMAHQAVKEHLVVGVTTEELDEMARRVIVSHGGTPSFETEYGFPGAVSVSINEEIGHGVPGKRVIQSGDLVKVDIGVEFEGYHSDCAMTHIVGTSEASSVELLETAKFAMEQGIEHAMPGKHLSDISHAIFTTIDTRGYSLIRNAFGHGIGQHLHEEPYIANFGPPHHGPTIRPGMVLAIEPLVSNGSRYVKELDNKWTTVTADGSYSAHFEHTVLITAEGAEILTALPGQSARVEKEQARLHEGEPGGWTPSGFKTEYGPEISVRKMQPDDRDTLLRIANEQMNPILLEAWGQRVEPGILDTEEAVTCVIETADGQTAGFYTWNEQEHALFLHTIVIDKPYQGRGIGKLVIRKLEYAARGKNLPAIELWVQSNNRKAISLYEKLGFVPMDHPFFNTIAMKKSVSSQIHDT